MGLPAASDDYTGFNADVLFEKDLGAAGEQDRAHGLGVAARRALVPRAARPRQVVHLAAGQCVLERFTVGGEYSVRGFETGTLGPFETYNGQTYPVGGYKYHTYNFEYVYKVNDPLRFVLWADAGKAYGYRENFNFGDLRYSMGAEMRVFLPVFQFPLRFIYAINPSPKECPDTTAPGTALVWNASAANGERGCDSWLPRTCSMRSATGS